MISIILLEKFRSGKSLKGNPGTQQFQQPSNSENVPIYYFIGINFREFFCRSRKFIPAKSLVSATRESLYSRNLTFEVSREILIKNTKKKVKIRMKIIKFGRNFPRSRKFIPAKFLKGLWPLAIAKVYPRESLYPRKFIPIKYQSYQSSIIRIEQKNVSRNIDF